MNTESRADLKKTKGRRLYIPLIVIFIIFDVVCDNYIFGSFNSQPPIREFILFIGLLFLQILSSPIQAGLSDFYGRKRSLTFSISVSLFSLLLVFLYTSNALPYFLILLLINLSKGIMGNTIPISWAAIGDTLGDVHQKNLRYSFALSEASYAIGYLLLVLLHHFFTVKQSILILIAIFIILLFICTKVFVDQKDTECTTTTSTISFKEFAKNEFKLVITDLRNQRIKFIFMAFILWEISLYSILILYADFLNHKVSIIEISMMIGYLIGTFLVQFCRRFNDHSMVKYGYIVSVFSLVPYFIFLPFIKEMSYILGTCYFFHAVGNALLSPTLLSIISKEKRAHERGKIYGLAESSDTFAFLVATIAIMCYKHMQLSIFYLVCLSFITMIISWLPYRHYEKIRRNSLPS